MIEIIARDANSQPVRGLTLRLETAVGGILADVGTLSARTVSTNNDGRASATFLAPPPPPPTAPSDTIIEFKVTPDRDQPGLSGQRREFAVAHGRRCAWRGPCNPLPERLAGAALLLLADDAEGSTKT